MTSAPLAAHTTPRRPTPRHRLRAMRRGYRRRDDRLSRGDLAYAVYCGVLITAAVAVPIGRGVVIGLGGSAIGPTLVGEGSQAVAGVILGWLLGLMAWWGRMIGPVQVSPFFAMLLGGTDMPRRRTLLPAMLRAAGVVVLVICSIAALLSGAAVYAGGATLAAAASFTAMAGGYAVIASGVWLAARALPARVTGIAGAALLGLTVLTWLVPGLLAISPWGWVAQSWLDIPGPDLVVPLIALATAALISVPWLLGRLSVEQLAVDGEHMSGLRSAAMSGDVGIGLGGIRATPIIGRRIRAFSGRGGGRGRWPAVQIVRSDAVGALRTVDRAGVAAITLAAAAGLAAAAPSIPTGWAAGAIAGGVAFACLGAFFDGVRHAAQARGTPAMFGLTDRKLTGIHLTWPAVVGVAVAAVGAVSAFVGAGDLSAARGTAAVGAVLISAGLARLYYVRKPPMPLELMTPVPTPGGGDASGLIMVLWQVDALLVSMIAGGIAVSLLS